MSENNEKAVRAATMMMIITLVGKYSVLFVIQCWLQTTV